MEKFVITIARGYGSGGRGLGQLLAKELGINYYDKEILKLAADSTGINKEKFENADEKIKGTLLQKVAKNVYKGENVEKQEENLITGDRLFYYQSEVLKQLAEKESFVVIGRCADYVLRDHENIVKIFVHAPIEKCVEVVENMTFMSRNEIWQFIYKTDNDRARYYYHHTGKAWLDARNYDLCFNTAETTLENCVEIVKGYLDVKYGIRTF